MRYGSPFYCYGSVTWRYAMKLIISERIFYYVFSTFISAGSVRAAGCEENAEIDYESSQNTFFFYLFCLNMHILTKFFTKDHSVTWTPLGEALPLSFSDPPSP